MCGDESMNLFLATERLTMRPLELGDIGLGIEMFTNPNVVRYVGDLMEVDDISGRMLTWIKRGGKGGCIGIWCVTRTDTGEKLGTGALLPIPIQEEDTNWDDVVTDVMPNGDVEVGYILKESAWGQGYATEICERLLRFVFEETPMTEVVATFDDENLKSRHVLEKCGLKDRGRRFVYGEDSVDFRITREEWMARVLSGQA